MQTPLYQYFVSIIFVPNLSVKSSEMRKVHPVLHVCTKTLWKPDLAFILVLTVCTFVLKICSDTLYLANFLRRKGIWSQTEKGHFQ